MALAFFKGDFCADFFAYLGFLLYDYEIRKKDMSKNKDDLFQVISKKIADSDFSGYTFQYPPLFSWENYDGEKNVKKYWKKRLSRKNDYIGIYVHIPFCKQRCTYCRYFSKKLGKKEELDRFLFLLKREVNILSGYFKKQKIHTLYIGGGTPSILSSKQIEELFKYLQASFNFSQCRQTVFEGNPDFLTFSKLKLLKKYNVSRLTIGVQSLDQKVIDFSNRFQTSGSFQRCIKNAKKVGIETINVDLMIGLPQQSNESFLKTLDEVVSFNPDMVHLHPFFPTNLTTFMKENNKISLREIKKREKMSELGQLILKKNGYGENELDANSKSKKDINFQLSDAIEHNSSFLGLGPGAVSHIAGYLRYANQNSLDGYIKALEGDNLPVLSSCKISEIDDMIYYVTSCLRYGKVSKQKFRELFGRELDEIFAREIAYLEKRKKIKNVHEFLLPEFKNLGEYTIFSKYFYSKENISEYEKKFSVEMKALRAGKKEDILFMDLI